MLLAALLATAWCLAPGSTAEARTAPGAIVESDVPYAQTSAQQVLDVHRSQPDAFEAPVVILVHGGGWRGGDKRLFTPAAQRLARHGYVVFNVNYRTGPEAVPGYKRQVSDVRLALGWVIEHAAEFGGNPDEVAMIGGSAGGHLVSLVASTANHGHATRVGAAVSLSGPLNIPLLVQDLRETHDACRARHQADRSCSDLGTAKADLEALLGCKPFQCPRSVLEDASPIAQVSSSTPPFFLANSADEVVPPAQARTMALALDAYRVPYELHIVPGDEHSVAYARLLAGDILMFLEEQLNAPTTPSPEPTEEDPREEPAARPRAPWIVPALGVLVVGAAVLAFTLRRGRRRPPRR